MTTIKPFTPIDDAATNDSFKYETFELHYSYSGLGSNMGSMQPRFTVKRKEFKYTLEQNSYLRKQTKKPKKICDGQLRNSSIDSILNLTKDIKDTLIYRTNVRMRSGGIHTISVKHEKSHITFTLHNATDTTALKIIDILNTNIPEGKQKLWLFNSQDDK